MILYPIYVTAAWFDLLPNGANHQFSWEFLAELDSNAVSMRLRAYACLINTVHTTVVTFCFYYLYKAFQLYAKGIIFSKQNISYLQKIGYTFLLQTIVWIIEQPILSYILTLENGSDQDLISIAFDSHDLSNLMIGGVIILISWIMNEAEKLEDDSALTI